VQDKLEARVHGASLNFEMINHSKFNKLANIILVVLLFY
jgi:hypothetical protein